MDSLHWRNLNQHVKIETTKKQYFNRYLWRLVYQIKKVNLVNDKHVHDIISHVREGRSIELNNKKYPPTSGGYTGFYYRPESWEGVDAVLLDRLRSIVSTFKHQVKFRCEFNTMQIYAETEEDLKRVAEAISHNDGIVGLSYPAAGTEQALRDGHVIMPKMDYKFKIVLRDGNYPVHIKQSIYNQLSQRDDVKIPPNLTRELGKKYPALWGAYFYSNDDSIVTVLSLISPGIIGKIHPIDQLQ